MITQSVVPTLQKIPKLVESGDLPHLEWFVMDDAAEKCIDIVDAFEDSDLKLSYGRPVF